jgi:hypothetical protein
MRLSRFSACFLSVLIAALPATARSAQDRVADSASDDVPADVAARVRTVAEGSAQLRPSLVQPRTVFIGVDLIRRKSEGEGERDLPALYRVQHYRYADDTVITSIVDLDGARVAEQTETRNAPVRLSEGELGEARTLALADPHVAAALGGREVVVEPLVVRTSDRADPWFGRRIVRLLFRLGADYLSQPIVFVDLTRRRVIIQPGHGPAHGDSR